MLSPDALTEPPPALSLADMAARLEVSRETLRGWLRKWPDFPILERGTHGQRYSFDPEAVVLFVRARRAAPSRDGCGQAGAIGFDLDLRDSSEGPASPSLRDRLNVERIELVRAQNRRLERLEAVARHDLVPVAAVLDALASALQQLGKANRTSIAASCRELGVPDAAARVFERNLNRDQRAFVLSLPAFLASMSLLDDPETGTPSEDSFGE